MDSPTYTSSSAAFLRHLVRQIIAPTTEFRNVGGTIQFGGFTDETFDFLSGVESQSANAERTGHSCDERTELRSREGPRLDGYGGALL